MLVLFTRRTGCTRDYTLGSVHAVTEDGQVLVASNTGSQLATYAAKMIWVVRAQKIVRIWAKPSAVNKVLLINKEIKSDRTTMIIVKEELGY